MPTEPGARVQRVLGSEVVSLTPLGGGCVGDVRRARLADGRNVVIKTADAGLAVEGRMLHHLAKSGLPVPDVHLADDDLLVMSWIEHGGGLDGDAQEHAADLIAALHDIGQDRFGFHEPTVIGGLHQPNPETESWTAFFRDHRLLYMAGEAARLTRLPASTMTRIEKLAGRLDRVIADDATPSLIHGDLWGGNVLAMPGHIAGFIDPAIYHADAEIELAFSTLFHTFGERFFQRYHEHRPIRPGFFEERRDLYNLYPLLVHVRLFGGHYVTSVERTLEKFGC